MLTPSSSQYIRPEYLTPLPTTLDAKNSPLALLAQTCSQIGADPPAAKSLAPEKSSKTAKSGENSREKVSPTSEKKATFKPYESCLVQDKSPIVDDQRSTSSRSTPSGGKRCGSSQSCSSGRENTPQSRRETIVNGDAASRSSPTARTSGQQSTRSESPMASTSQSIPKTSTYNPAGMLAITDPAIKDLPLGTFRAGPVCTIPSSTAGYMSYTSQLPIDVMASSLISQHHAALKSGLANPYLAGYPRIKPGQGAESLMTGICRESFCPGCPLCPHPLSSPAKIPNSGPLPPTSCPTGCLQCDHKTSQTSQASAPYAHMGVGAYAHAQLAALAVASQLPYICSWVSADSVYCGKRYASSEELLQHLKSHTSLSPNAAAGVDPATLTSMLTPPMGLPPTHPLFARAYPTTPPLSPLATARFHPYNKPSPLLPPSLSALGLPVPGLHPHSSVAAGLNPYYSPYTIYGASRLGATSSMHP